MINATPGQDAFSRESHELREKISLLENTLDSAQRQRRERYNDVSAIQTALRVRADAAEAENRQLRRQLDEAKQRPVAQATSMQALCQVNVIIVLLLHNIK